jgi:hypothetical protein
MRLHFSFKCVLALAAAGALGACATAPPAARDKGNATVTAVRSLQPFSSGTGVGGVAGAALLGAGAAGAAGSAGIQRGAVGAGSQGVGGEFVAATVWEVTVELDAGSERVVRLDRAPPYSLGARVVVTDGRVEPAH